MTITDEQIHKLAAEAEAAGDVEQFAICERALLGPTNTGAVRRWPDVLWWLDERERAAYTAARRLTVAEARAECERVVQEGGAR